jgi:hypothetical protein
MIQLTFGQQALLITIPLLTLVASNHADAEIYKWRDNRGVTQYSDRPPVDSFSKVTPNELVNSLQTKDLCVVGPIKKNTASTVASTKDYSGFFTSIITPKNTAATPATSIVTALNLNKNNVTILGLSKAPTPPIQVVTAPPKITPPVVAPPVTKPATPAVTTPPATKPTVPVVTPPPATKPAEPVVTAPPVTKPVEPVVTTPPVTSLPNIIQKGLMPAVNISKNIIPAVGFSALRIQPTTEVAPKSLGEFRVSCLPSHMSNDDPIVYPNQQGAAHHHTFYGNTSVNYKSDLMSFATTGNSTCSGGIMNRSAYWVPSMIDTSTGTPLLPMDGAIFYYKVGSLDGSVITAPPKGLRMITGDMTAKAPSEKQGAMFTCINPVLGHSNGIPWTKHIPNCPVGNYLEMAETFPQCWDGKNLDSPNHQDHMAFVLHRPVAPPNDFYCPATHPVPIPEVSIHLKFTVTKPNQTQSWRLSSDNYSADLPGGYSSHADWVNGWDQTILNGIVKNCLNGKKDGHAHLLCDGRMFYD